MAQKYCPVCEEVIFQTHDCLHSEITNFSIELELLELPFGLEPYGPVEEPAYIVSQPAPEYDSSERACPEFDPIYDLLMNTPPKRKIPFFLRV